MLHTLKQCHGSIADNMGRGGKKECQTHLKN